MWRTHSCVPYRHSCWNVRELASSPRNATRERGHAGRGVSAGRIAHGYKAPDGSNICQAELQRNPWHNHKHHIGGAEMKGLSILGTLGMFCAATTAQQYVISSYAGGALFPTPVLGTAVSIGEP